MYASLDRYTYRRSTFVFVCMYIPMNVFIYLYNKTWPTDIDNET